MKVLKGMKIFEGALLLALGLALCAGTWAQGRQSAISAKLVRLHVIAASDSEYEQALKLRVRDAVLKELEMRLEGVTDSAEARRKIGAALSDLGVAARDAAEGREITVSLSCESYPTRRYEGFALPAGEYESLRVTIGEGCGRNWWCVVFPPLCTDATLSGAMREAMSREECGIICEEEGYELRFRTLELWGELTAWLGHQGAS